MTNQWITEVEKLRAELAAYKAKKYDPAESIRLNAEVMEWKSLCFAQGMKLKGLEIKNRELLEACKAAREYIDEYCPEIGGILTITLDAAIAREIHARCEK